MRITQQKCVLIVDRSAEKPHLMNIQVSLARAARTDAGVHAAGNVVSLKMIITIPGVSDLVAKINEELPPEIRVWGYVSHSATNGEGHSHLRSRVEPKIHSMLDCEFITSA